MRAVAAHVFLPGSAKFPSFSVIAKSAADASIGSVILQYFLIDLANMVVSARSARNHTRKNQTRKFPKGTYFCNSLNKKYVCSMQLKTLVVVSKVLQVVAQFLIWSWVCSMHCHLPHASSLLARKPHLPLSAFQQKLPRAEVLYCTMIAKEILTSWKSTTHC